MVFTKLKLRMQTIKAKEILNKSSFPRRRESKSVSAAFFDLQPFWLEVDALDSRLRGNDGANKLYPPASSVTQWLSRLRVRVP
jgi:hypothetical protein